MPRGGFRPGAGRKKMEPVEGQAASRVPESQIEDAPADAEVLTPLEYMLRVMNNSQAQAHRRDRMAVAAAPYVHGNRAGDAPLGKKEQRAAAAKEAVKAFPVPSAPPGLSRSN